jgi:hypothetical protein
MAYEVPATISATDKDAISLKSSIKNVSQAARSIKVTTSVSKD